MIVIPGAAKVNELPVADVSICSFLWMCTAQARAQMAAHTYFVGKSDRVTSVVVFNVDSAQYVVVQFVSGQDTGL